MAAKKATSSAKYWLMKSEPHAYSIQDLAAEKTKTTHWDGVRNYEARNNLRAMKQGDFALYYHSNEGKEVVGVARIIRESYQDPTIDDDRWVVVDLEPVVPFSEPVTLATIKADAPLAEISLIKRSRLSVVPVEKKEFLRILKLGKTKLPASQP